MAPVIVVTLTATLSAVSIFVWSLIAVAISAANPVIVPTLNALTAVVVAASISFKSDAIDEPVTEIV